MPHQSSTRAPVIRRRCRPLARIGAALAVACALLGIPIGAVAAPTTFSHTGGAQSWVVPQVNTVLIEAWGAQGGYDLARGGVAYGGLGAYVSSAHGVTPGESLQVNVGGRGGLGVTTQSGSGYAEGGLGGFNGGGRGGSNPGLSVDIDFYGSPGGGGASDVRRGGTALGNRIIVAGGGGGGAFRGDVRCSFLNAGRGGAGGAPNGANGIEAARANYGGFDAGTGGGGATASAGGAAAASYWSSTSWPATAGTLGQGGDGSSYDINYYNPGQGAGGGGGYYGGGGGGNAYECGNPGGGGGGGSSASFGSNVTMAAGARADFGQVTITPVEPAPSTSLAQFRADGTTSIPAGAVHGATDVVLKFNVADPQAGRSITPWIEIRSNGAAFGGSCGAALAGTVISGAPLTAIVANTPYQASVTVTGLPQGTHRWRACATDGSGMSAWTDFGPGTPDFTVDTVAPSAPTLVTPAASTTTSSTPALTATYGDVAPGTAGLLTFEVCGDSACSTAARTLTSAAGTAPGTNGSATVGAALAPGTWYWRARGTDGAGLVGPWSSTSAFRVGPTLASATPSSVAQGRRGIVVRLAGSYFQSGATVSVAGTGVTVTGVSWVNAAAVDATLDVAGAAALGARDVTLTNPDGGTIMTIGLLTVAAPSITIAVSTLNHADGARTSTGPYAIAFGPLFPGVTRSIGPAGSGQALPGPAIRIGVTSDTHTQSLLRATAPINGGTSTMPVSALQFRLSSDTTWTPMATADQAVASMRVPGTSNVDADLQVAVPASQQPGTYNSTLVLTVIPQP